MRAILRFGPDVVLEQTMILALDGLDGSGKSSVAREVARRLGVPAHRPLDAAGISATPAFMADYASDGRYLFYLAACAALLERYGGAGHWVVADRFLASAHAMHVDAPGAFRAEDMGRDLSGWGCSVLLEVDEAVRRRRLSIRGRPLDPFEERLVRDAAFRDRVLSSTRNWPYEAVIDTTEMAIADAAAAVCGVFRRVAAQTGGLK